MSTTLDASKKGRLAGGSAWPGCCWASGWGSGGFDTPATWHPSCLSVPRVKPKYASGNLQGTLLFCSVQVLAPFLPPLSSSFLVLLSILRGTELGSHLWLPRTGGIAFFFFPDRSQMIMVAEAEAESIRVSGLTVLGVWGQNAERGRERGILQVFLHFYSLLSLLR